jgi:hypothetical protein
METIFVTASQKTGRYDGPIIVRLTASHPDASIWYTCRRDGTPSDLIKYEKPVLLSKSCAMIYFAYVTTQLESKIERTDFTILYSNDIKLETEEDLLLLRNVGKDTVDVGGWELIAGTGSIVIPPGTSVTPGQSYSVGKVDPASYALKSPEGYVKSELSVAPKPPVAKPTVKKYVAKAPKAVNPPPAVSTPTVPAGIRAPETPSTTPVVIPTVTPPPATTPPVTTPPKTIPPVTIEPVPAANPPVATPTVTETVKKPESTPSVEVPLPVASPTPPPAIVPTIPAPSPAITPQPPTVAQAPKPAESSASDIKASSTESKNTATLPIVVALMLLVVAGIVAKRSQEKK